MPTFTLTQEPEENELAFGPIIATTYNSDADGFTHALQIINTSDDEIIATLRQQPNQVGYTHFDLSPILQRQITNNPQLADTSVLNKSTNEGYEYYIKYGWIDNDNLFDSGSDGTSTKRVLYGRKPFSEVDWDSTSYTPNLSNAGITNVIDDKAYPFTDRNYDVVDASTLTTKPLYVAGDVWKMIRRFDDTFTLSYMNQWIGTPLASFNGINGFDIKTYDSDNILLNTYEYLNITSNGGGPNVAYNDELMPNASYSMISIQVGKLNDDFGVDTDVAFYYIVPFSYYYDPDTATDKIYPWFATRIDIDNGECNDFSPIQVSWVNSLGARDYYTFEKRNDYNINITRNNYNKTFSSWNETSYNPQQYDRGTKTYNTEIQETYVANTKYLSDDESSYLKNLFISPDVSVRFEGDDTWTPVILTSNSWNEKTFRKDKLFQHTINFKLANNPQIQNG